MSNERKSIFDIIKGMLIFLMIFGHITPGSFMPTFSGENINPVRIAIYYFHMPVFFILSAYLGGRRTFVGDGGWKRLREKISPLILVFLFSSLVYQLLFKRTIEVNFLYLVFWDPFNHLWFLEIFVSYIIFMGIADRARWSFSLVFFIALFASLGVLGFRSHLMGIEESPPRILIRFFEYLPFYLLGVWLRRKPIPDWLSIRNCAILCGLGLVAGAISLGSVGLGIGSFLYAVGFLSFNIGLGLLLPILNKKSFSGMPVLGAVGRSTLFIYIWHYFFTYLFSAKFPTGAASVPIGLLVAVLIGGGLLVTERILKQVFRNQPRIIALAGVRQSEIHNHS